MTRAERIVVKIDARLTALNKALEKYEGEMFILGKDTIVEMDPDGSDVCLDQKIERIEEEIKYAKQIRKEYRVL